MLCISVIIPTYNPNATRLNRTLGGLKKQTFDKQLWELIIIDNNSSNQFAHTLDINWHPAARIVTEKKQGLTHARLKGFSEAKGELIVMVDDDNILDENYLQTVAHIFSANTGLGSIGGKSIPLFEREPPEWLSPFYSALALRNLGDDEIINHWANNYPAEAPIGAGMALRRAALSTYIAAHQNGANVLSDRSAGSLSSSGDNEIILEVLKSGWPVGYYPQLILQHIIPAGRMTKSYMAKLVYGIHKSWAMLLSKHDISPWPAIPKSTVPFRKIKSYFANKAWRSHVNYLRWKETCGLFDGLAERISK